MTKPDLTNTAPKRIYLDIGDQFALERVASGDLRWDLLDGVTWSEDNATSHGIPYVRADLVPTPAASGAAPDDMREALREAQIAINSMKQEAETASQLDEEAMLEALDQISRQGLEADMAIRAALASREASPATLRPEEIDAVVSAAREWCSERMPEDWAEEDLMKAVIQLDGDWEGCDECDHQCDEPCRPATVTEMLARIDSHMADLVHAGKVCTPVGYVPPEGWKPTIRIKRASAAALASPQVAPEGGNSVDFDGIKPAAFRYKLSGDRFEYHSNRLDHFYWNEAEQAYRKGEPLFLATPVQVAPQGNGKPWDTLTALEKAPKLIEELESESERITRCSNSPLDGLLQSAANVLRELTATVAAPAAPQDDARDAAQPPAVAWIVECWMGSQERGGWVPQFPARQSEDEAKFDMQMFKTPFKRVVSLHRDFHAITPAAKPAEEKGS